MQLRRICLFLFASSVFYGPLSESSARAMDPGFGFAFGYSVGQMNQFRNRLPVPPYFAIYPPVYYGTRYMRPYGESPFASWPLLTAGDDYRPQPASTPVHYANPHATSTPACPTTVSPIANVVPFAPGNFVTIENPFASANESIASR